MKIKDPQTYIDDLERQVAQLQESNRDLEHFAYVASHDLQAPLRTMKGYLTLINRSLPEDTSDDVREYFEHVFAGVKQLQQLIEDLLSYSRAGRQVERQRIQTDAMLEIVQFNLRKMLEERPVHIQIDKVPAEFYGHRTWINQLFQNLLSNAIRFSKEGETHQIIIRGEEDPTYWTFHISDTGIGIAAEDQSRIFELFTRLQAREFSEQGTGIGLALCKRVVEAHGGRIWVDSTPGEGSIFHFTIKKELAKSDQRGLASE